MIRNCRWKSALLSGVLVLLSLTACKPQDPAKMILTERAQWDVSLARWYPKDDTLSLALRIKNPRNATLRTLTLQVLFLDESNTEIATQWAPVDVSQIRRGIPEDQLLVITPPDVDYVGIAVQIVPAPDEQQRSHLRELTEITP